MSYNILLDNNEIAHVVDVTACDIECDVLTEVGGQYGAPMGRQSSYIEPGIRYAVMEVVLDDGYDSGGAYWGWGESLYLAYAAVSGDEFLIFRRAPSVEQFVAESLDNNDYYIAT